MSMAAMALRVPAALKRSARATDVVRARLVGSALRGRTAAGSMLLSNKRFQSSTPENRGVDRIKPDLKIAQKTHGYVVENIQEVADRNMVSYLLRHEATGAQHLHIDCPDENNVFSVTFKTVPTDSTGVAHILEHTVLCGSELYPVRDPFFNMLQRSLQTYMNAWTGSDFTMYPFSTYNKQDFNNLLSVYLDATFFPLIKEMDFHQEGHRLEPADLNDPKSPCIYKGVVYNEMKGAMADPSSLFSQELATALYPTTTYHHNSGGAPSDIPHLTYDALKKFHADHYHPSNSFFLTYGDMPLETHLKTISESVLDKFSAGKSVEVDAEKRYAGEKRFHVSGPMTAGSDPSKQEKLSVAFLTNDITDTFECFSMQILSSLLMNGPNAPLYKALLDSNLAMDFSPSTGYDGSTRDCSFSVGVSGVSADTLPHAEKIIMETLEQTAATGFERERIDSILHQIELGEKHITGNFGLTLASGLMHRWIHGTDPCTLLDLKKWLGMFKEGVDNGLLESLIRKHMLDNPHRVVLRMSPDDQYAEKEVVEEEKAMQAANERLSESERESLFDIGKTLQQHQEDVQDVSCLPTLTAEDIPRNIPHTDPVSETTLSHKVPFQWTAQPTNTMVYYRMIASIKDLGTEYVPYLPLFALTLGSMGTKQQDYRALAQSIESTTGGIGTSASVDAHHTNPSAYEPYLMIGSSCLERNIPNMFSLLQEVVSSSLFDDHDRLRSLINQCTMSAQESLVGSGHVYAMSAASAPLSDVYHYSEAASGVTQVRVLQNLAAMEDLTEVSDTLKRMAHIVLNRDTMRVSAVSEPHLESTLQSSIETFLDVCPTRAVDATSGPWQFDRAALGTDSFVPVPESSVNFCARAIPAPDVTYNHPDLPKLQILSKLVSMQYLHKEVREKGGAYGGGLVVGSGRVAYYSYRDPHVERTLKVFDGTADWVARSDSFDARDLEQAKLGVFAGADSPVAPSSKNLSYFKSGVTNEMRQTFRDRLFSVTETDLKDVADKYLRAGNGSTAVVGGAESEKKWESAGGKWSSV